MDKDENPRIPKKPYIKPKITEVELVAEEAVLALCKDGASNAFSFCYPEFCVQQGGS